MMTLYSGSACPFSHRCRIVLFEKGMDFHIEEVDLEGDSADAIPYGEIPVLVERDLVLFEANIINEYLDERFPHPQLVPAEPAMRARMRLFLLRFEKEIFSWVRQLELGREEDRPRARAAITQALLSLTPIFSKHEYLLGQEPSLLDMALAPLLWRLPLYGIELSKNASGLKRYAQGLFSRPAFQESLTLAEKAMR